MKSPHQQLIAEVARAEGVTLRLATAVIERYWAELPARVRALGAFCIPHALKFRVSARKPKRIRHPKTLEEMTTPARRVVAARVCSSWRFIDG